VDVEEDHHDLPGFRTRCVGQGGSPGYSFEADQSLGFPSDRELKSLPIECGHRVSGFVVDSNVQQDELRVRVGTCPAG